MATTDILRLPERVGGASSRVNENMSQLTMITATQFLFSHIYNTSLIRQFSITKDFNPGAPPLNYMALTDEARTAVQYHINQLNRNSFDPRHAVWAVNNVFLLRGELVFVAENLTAVPRPRSRRGQYRHCEFAGVYVAFSCLVAEPEPNRNEQNELYAYILIEMP